MGRRSQRHQGKFINQGLIDLFQPRNLSNHKSYNLATIRFLSRIESIINNISESLLLNVHGCLQNITQRQFNDGTDNNNIDTELHVRFFLCVV